jgi:shikimate dehydrogenase
MRKFGLIGYPLGHSFSQKYFSEKFASQNISGCIYSNYPLTDISRFPSLISSDSDICGLNVTIPYKTAILRFADIIDPVVSDIGAANVLRITRRHGKISVAAFNSDVTGIEETLKPFFGGKGGKALILGTGGASRAVVWTLRKMGFMVTLVSRTPGYDTIGYKDINRALLNEIDLIVNTTPLGMFPETNGLPEIDYSALGNRHTLFDLVYNPEQTRFLLSGKERGCRIITGLKMLYSQAERSWEIWNNAGFRQDS